MLFILSSSLLLKGISYLYALFIKTLFFPFTFLKRLILNLKGGGYRSYSNSFQIIDIAKGTTIAIAIISLFYEDLIREIPYEWKEVIGVLCVATAIFSLYRVVKGSFYLILKSLFWSFIAILVFNSFFPSGLLRLKFPSSYSGLFDSLKHTSTKSGENFIVPKSKFFISRSDSATHSLKDSKLSGNNIFEKSFNNGPMNFMKRIIEPNTLNHKKPFTEKTFSPESKSSAEKVLPESLSEDR